MNYFLLQMPIPAGAGAGGAHGPSCFDKIKLGFGMGMVIGMASGFVFGGFGAIRHGARGRELISLMGKSMLQAGGTFGTFMSVGTAIRC